STRDDVQKLKEIVNRPGGVFSLSPTDRGLLRLASAPNTIAGITIPPIGAGRFTKQQLDDANTLRTLGEGTSIMTMRRMGEKGQGVTGAAYKQTGDNIFPGFADNQRSANAKLNATIGYINTDLKNGVSKAPDDFKVAPAYGKGVESETRGVPTAP